MLMVALFNISITCVNNIIMFKILQVNCYQLLVYISSSTLDTECLMTYVQITCNILRGYQPIVY